MSELRLFAESADESGGGVGAAPRMAYRPAEVAAALGLSRKAIYRAVGTGELRAARVCRGSRLVIPVDAVREWIEENLAPARRRAPRLEAGAARPRRVVRGPLTAALRALEDGQAGAGGGAREADQVPVGGRRAS